MNEHTRQTPDVGDDWLDAVLRDDAREHRAEHIDDAGFTARVVAALPAPASLPAWRKPAVAALWTGAAIGIAVALPGTIEGMAWEALEFVGRHPVSMANILTGLVALGFSTWAAAAYALRRTY